MGCPVLHDLNNYLMVSARQDALAEQVDSELIDGEHLDDFIDGMSGEAFHEAAAYLMREVVCSGKSVGDAFDGYVTSFKALVAEKIRTAY